MGYRGQPYTNESLVMGGSVAAAKYNPLQGGALAGKDGEYGKMTPMYEKQQFLLNQKRGIFGPGANNVFSSLNESSIHSSAAKQGAGSG